MPGAGGGVVRVRGRTISGGFYLDIFAPISYIKIVNKISFLLKNRLLSLSLLDKQKIK